LNGWLCPELRGDAGACYDEEKPRLFAGAAFWMWALVCTKEGKVAIVAEQANHAEELADRDHKNA
jgi:hypothetical protein